MPATQEYTYTEVKGHNTKKDLFMVIHDKVYSVGSFVDEHPGGEEVLMDVGGQDATDSFEDVGHSDEAREILEGLLVGKLRRTESDPKPKLSATTTSQTGSSTDAGTALYAFVLLAAIVAFGAWKYVQ
ncbi:cytochrome b5-like heme/steroid binding domain-containing protein [Pyronema domesticum]|uniref:Similar to Probable cytochrome b5 acc. no. Q9P5L0 n=1 Tax=Pyronema omphalodes (strain CBS 100304) TaxID=1076935 RepID=U4LC08_PYROM|nr:cytochrome b5-like heme/steroid binding domain-containing protein [Pyronema domesticum]CCX16992.1 Similar to Probable cytochrome b5; acc. no. Q9P5L0 [Pyronema omphalodes CBS 100304]